MTVWWVVLGLVIVCAMLRAVGPAVLGDHQLPAPVGRMVAVLAPALLAGLIVTEVGGEHWEDLDAGVVVGVLVAGVARLFRVPTLLAVTIGAVVTAGMRAMTG